MGNDACCSPSYDENYSQPDNPKIPRAHNKINEPIQSDFEGMNILDFEQRVKTYASFENKGFISPE